MNLSEAIFSAGSVYGVEHGSVYYRSGANVQPLAILPSASNFEGRVSVRGLLAGDFAVFASVFDDAGATDMDFLVTKTCADGSSIMVPSTALEEDLHKYATHELALKLQDADYDEIEQFGLTAMLQELDRRYPRSKNR